jgi:ribosomal protein S18 acetylase RimI-like enzyme
VSSDPVVLRPTIDRAWLERAAAVDPIEHAFALWDLDQYPDRVRFVSATDSRTTHGYLLVWLGHPAAPIVHWVGESTDAGPLVEGLPARPLVAVVPESAQRAVEGARGPTTSVPLLRLVAGPGTPGTTAPGIRRLGRSDRGTLSRWASGRTNPVVAEYPGLDPEREAIWGFFEGDRLLGVVRAEVRLPTVWLVGGVYVDPAARGRGVGLSLVRAVLDAGRAARAVVALYVREDRPAARTVYERAGFRSVVRRVWIDAGAGLEP